MKEQKQLEANNWDLVLRPKSGWFDVHLRDLLKYRDLIFLFVRRDFVAVYKQTVLGPLWFLIQPVLTALIFLIVFGKIANISTGETPKFLFYLGGLVCWNYFADCLNKTSNTFITNAGIFGKVYFPRLAVPVSIVISSMLSFSIQLVLFAAVYFYYWQSGSNVHLSTYILLLPILVLIMAGLGLGVGIIISSLTTKYRDLRFLVSFGVQLLMYISCVIYPLQNITSENYRTAIQLNPMSIIIETFRFASIGHGHFSWASLGYAAGVTLAVLFVGILLFNKVEKSFMDTV